MTRLFAVVVLVACSGRAPAPTGPTGPDEPRGSAHVVERGSAGSGTADVPPPQTKVTEADCHAMIDHVIDIDLQERPADQQLGPEQRAEVQTQMRTQHGPACLQQSKATVACIMAAATSAAIRACEP